MTIWQRVQRVFAANAHAAVDELENPQAMLNQVQRELVEAIIRLKGATKRGQRWGEQMEADIDTLIGEIARLERTAEDAIAGDDEPLARRAVERKLRKQQYLVQKQRQLERAKAQLAKQEDRLEKLRYELDELKAKSRELIQRQRFADVFASTTGTGHAEPVGIVVDRMQEKVEMAEAACEVSLDFDEQDPLDQELARQDIDEELRQMRARLRGMATTVEAQ